MSLHIAILGTRGIPNHYGGYEQAVSFLAPALVNKGYRVTVYNSRHHPWKQKEWNGVEIVHCQDPENSIGTAGQFIYDWNCIKHACKRSYDVILMMGYTSSSIWGRFYPKKTIIISNMDGLEWKRTKYSPPVRQFLRYAEKLAIRFSHFLIADSPAIQTYLLEKYDRTSRYIPYGAVIHNHEDENDLKTYGLTPNDYFLLIARIEPENNILPILQGYLESRSEHPFVVVGDTDTPIGKKLLKLFGNRQQIKFIGAVYDQKKLHSLRRYCRLYFHGHSVGGTNPSLLEAMASSAMIAAHDNPFNRAVTGNNALYFSNKEDIRLICSSSSRNEQMISANLCKIQKDYNWKVVADAYESFILDCYNQKKK